MTKPTPQGGLVIRYDYLWLAEEREGREEGAKIRPCAIVVAVRAAAADPLRVVVCGITHTRPTDEGEEIGIPPAVKAHLGLDDKESWIVTSEVNLVDWDDPGSSRSFPANGPTASSRPHWQRRCATGLSPK